MRSAWHFLDEGISSVLAGVQALSNQVDRSDADLDKVAQHKGEGADLQGQQWYLTGRRGNIAVGGLKDERIVGCLDEDLVVCDREAASSRGSPGDRYAQT